MFLRFLPQASPRKWCLISPSELIRSSYAVSGRPARPRRRVHGCLAPARGRTRRTRGVFREASSPAKTSRTPPPLDVKDRVEIIKDGVAII